MSTRLTSSAWAARPAGAAVGAERDERREARHLGLDAQPWAARAELDAVGARRLAGRHGASATSHSRSTPPAGTASIPSPSADAAPPASGRCWARTTRARRTR